MRCIKPRFQTAKAFAKCRRPSENKDCRHPAGYLTGAGANPVRH
ncbi:hypothetical protein [Kingella potus]|nr:hypothetical protein [Kingella potus]